MRICHSVWGFSVIRTSSAFRWGRFRLAGGFSWEWEWSLLRRLVGETSDHRRERGILGNPRSPAASARHVSLLIWHRLRFLHPPRTEPNFHSLFQYIAHLISLCKPGRVRSKTQVPQPGDGIGPHPHDLSGGKYNYLVHT